MKNTPKLMFSLAMYFPVMQIFFSGNISYLRLTQPTNDIWTLMVDIDDYAKLVAKSNKKIDIEPIVFNPTGIDSDYRKYLPELIKTRGKSLIATQFISFDISKQFDIDKYTDIICNAFSELGFRLVEVTHTNIDWQSDSIWIDFYIEVINPLFEEE